MKQVPFSTFIDKQNNIRLKKNISTRFLHLRFIKFFAFVQSGIRIISSTKKEKQLTGTEREIIEKIHHLRYADENSYVTTGGHFSQLYVRNLGIFLNALLDPRIPSSKHDWLKRQKIALRTVALDLEIFSHARTTYTTIVRIWKNIYSAMNIYTHPSDSLFGMLYTLCALSDNQFISSLFPAQSKGQRKLQTSEAVKSLLEEYKSSLITLIQGYKTAVLNPKTGLIRTDICLASARDGIKRQSSFYDNVICWSTIRLAKLLNLITISEIELQAWKEKIIAAFWDEPEGIFIDDLSVQSQEEKRFCADAFIITSSGFFDIKNRKDREKLEKMISYVQAHLLDKPFPLQYSKKNDKHRLYWPVRFGATSYVGESIWSHWGIEYIKALILLGQNKSTYLEKAKKHLNAYKLNIEIHGGYPELYDTNGNVFTTPFYKSVLHNSWVINYEQAKMLLKSSC